MKPTAARKNTNNAPQRQNTLINIKPSLGMGVPFSSADFFMIIGKRTMKISIMAGIIRNPKLNEEGTSYKIVFTVVLLFE